MMNGVIGGALIGLAAVWLMASLGRIAGISGIAAQALRGPGSAFWAVLFIVGLGVGGHLGHLVTGQEIFVGAQWVSWPLILGGLLVGFGTRLGSGCTSGHGVCGIARLSPRSITATVVFMIAGVATATIVHVAGAP